jgi:hypothetical protein
MASSHRHIRRVLGVAIGAAALVLPASALADCATAVDSAAFKGTVAQYYPQACYTAGLKKLGADANTYAPNVARNLRSAMRRDRTRKLVFTVMWLPNRKAVVSSSVKLANGIQLRKGKRVLATASIAGTATQLRLKKPSGKLTIALVWTLGKAKLTVTKPAPAGAVAANLKTSIQWLPKRRVRIRTNAKVAGGIQLRRGAKVVSRGAINGTTTTLRLAKTRSALTVALVWTVGKSRITVTKPARVLAAL